MQTAIESAPTETTLELADPLYRAARGLFYLGLFMSSLLVARIGAFTLGDILLIVSLGLLGVARLTNERSPWPRSDVSPGFMLLVGACFVFGALLSTAQAILPWDSLGVVARLVLLMLIVPWQARYLLPTSRKLAVAAGWLCAGAVVSAGATLAQFTFGAEVIPGADVTEAGRFSGATGHVSDLGGITAMALPLALGFLILTQGWRRLWSMIAFTALGIGLILSGSVSGMLAFTVAVFVLLVRRALLFRYVFVIGALALTVAWAASSIQTQQAALDPLQRVLQTLGITQDGRYSTSTLRLETFEAAMRSVGESLFIGRGFDALSAIADGVFPPHNILVGALFQGGLLLAFAVVALLIRPFAGGWTRADKSVLTSFLLASTIAAITFAMTAPSLYNRYLWLPVALLVVARSIAKNRPQMVGSPA